MSDLQGTLIIATGPHGWGGAVQSLCRSLESLAELGARVAYVALDEPYPIRKKPDSRIAYYGANLIASAAVGYATAPVVDQYALLPEILAERMAKVVRTENFERLILWGNYVFPFMGSTLRAHSILEHEGIEADVWLSPHGSDIWDIGKNLQGVVHSLLSDETVSHVIAPSPAFAEEIRRDYGVTRPISAIYPMVDLERFRPPSPTERRASRKALNIPENAFVISNHSNMRPVKRAEDVLELSGRLAEKLDKPVVLLMVGPERPQLIEDARQYRAQVDLRWIGVVDDVETYLFASDTELNCSWHDSFNLSLAEAMACAVPCVSTDVVGVGKEILAANAGFLFPYLPFEEKTPERYEDAVDYLLRLAQDAKLRQVMGANGAEQAARLLAPKQLREQYLALIASKSLIPVED